MSDWKTTDQRRYARFEILDYASVTTNGEKNSTSVVVVDVGLGGIQFRSKDSMEAGTTFTLSIGSKQEDTICFSCEATHIRAMDDGIYAIGCRFRPQNHEERVAVAEYVHAVFQRQGERLVG